MCSHFLSSADPSLARSLVSGDVTYRYNTSFTSGTLPLWTDPGLELSVSEASGFLDFLFNGLLRQARAQGSCGSCWAYSLTGCVEYAARRAYHGLGYFLNQQYMSHQYLLTCMQIEGAACGCWGGDLPAAFRALAERGAVSFLQFPYENDESVATSEGDVHYVCKSNVDAGGYLGTCGPCAEGEVSLETMVSAASFGAKAPQGFLEVVTCMPCESVGGPFYHPLGPFTLYDPKRTLQQNVDAVKRALRRAGPLSTALRINQQDFAALGQAGLLTDLREAPVYRPARVPSAGGLHAVLVVGYYDPWAQTGSEEDRRRAVFVCRNSWGPDWGFQVRTRTTAADRARRLAVTSTVIGGFFCVAMYDAFEATGLLEHSIGIEGVEIRPGPQAAARPLSWRDPFLIKFPPGMQRDLETFYSAPAWSLAAQWSSDHLAAAPPPAAALDPRLPWMWAAALCVLGLIVAIALW